MKITIFCLILCLLYLSENLIRTNSDLKRVKAELTKTVEVCGEHWLNMPLTKEELEIGHDQP